MAVINLCQLPALLQGTVFIKPKDFFQGLIVVQLILVVKSRNIFLQVDWSFNEKSPHLKTTILKFKQIYSFVFI